MMGGTVSCQSQGASNSTENPTPLAEQTPTVEAIDPADEIVTRVVQEQVTNVSATPEAINERVILDVSLIGADILTLDPQRNENPNELTLIENLYVGLTRFNHADQAIEPMLAERWEISADGLEWTFYLRDDIFWVKPVASSTIPILLDEPELEAAEAIRPVVADDIVYAVRRACDPRINTPNSFVLFIIQGCEQVNAKNNVTGFDLINIEVEAPDKQTVIFRLNEPAAYFLTLTTLPIMRPVPTEVVALSSQATDWSWPEDSDEVITNGPFLLDPQTIRGTQIVLQKNPLWPVPSVGNVDQVNFFQFDNRQEAFDLWSLQQLDITPLARSQQEDIMENSPQKIAPVPEQTVFYLAFNFDSPVFQSPELRRAFSAAIDREQIIEEVYAEAGLPMRHLTPPGAIGAPPPDILGVGYNPDFARQQLVASGISACGFLPEIRYMVNSSDLALFQAELVRDMWVEELGCNKDNIIIEQVQFGTLLANTRPEAGNLRPDIWDLGWSAYYPDTHNWLFTLLHCSESDNRIKRPCGELDQLIIRAGRSEIEQRDQLYRRIETGFFGDDGETPIAPIYARSDFQLRQTWVIFTPAPFGSEQYDTYEIDWELKKLEQQQ